MLHLINTPINIKPLKDVRSLLTHQSTPTVRSGPISLYDLSELKGETHSQESKKYYFNNGVQYVSMEMSVTTSEKAYLPTCLP